MRTRTLTKARISGTRRRTVAVAALAGAVLLAGACGSGAGDTVGAVPASAPVSGVEAPGSPTDVVTPDSTSGADNDADPGGSGSGSGSGDAEGVAVKTLPNLVGKGLQTAQDRTQDAGFRRMTSHDAAGRERVQILDRDWKVCFQSPAPGTHPADTKIDFGTVKLDERCPGKDKGSAPTPAKETMPNLKGKSAAAAFAFLGLDASITWRDGTGADRAIVLPTNWKVCSQKPKAGAKYNGVPVTLTVVKVSEDC